jgi:hypothetical protein
MRSRSGEDSGGSGKLAAELAGSAELFFSPRRLLRSLPFDYAQGIPSEVEGCVLRG